MGDDATDEWRSAAIVDPDEPSTHGLGTITWNSQVTIPSGEELVLGAVYAEANRSLNIVVSHNGKQLLNMSGFKLKPTTYDPTALFLTPGGLHVQVMVGI
ncbi:hypothetical protein DSM104443_00259 [Usitatibacter rugosus]|uniref:Uncharacterized protein n=1 Tax=Usitatibacter rugosus TaxID=2732067 RepID=A0A6M4GPW9_9PROT|nr:hypothetical protein DSM104443_00259 [Usitatibacter rugosus]